MGPEFYISRNYAVRVDPCDSHTVEIRTRPVHGRDYIGNVVVHKSVLFVPVHYNVVKVVGAHDLVRDIVYGGRRDSNRVRNLDNLVLAARATQKACPPFLVINSPTVLSSAAIPYTAEYVAPRIEAASVLR